MNKSPSQEIAQLLVQYKQFNKELAVFDLDDIDIASIPSALMNGELMQRHRAIPLFQQVNQLHVAMAEPVQHDALKDIQFHTGLYVVPVIVETHKLTRLINQLLHQHENQGLADLIAESDHDDPTEQSCEDQPVVKFVKRIILEAIEQNASDIHFEPYEQEYRIRYRQDGFLIAVAAPPLTLSARIAARIKIMSNLDISERRIPQDGRFSMRITHTKTIDFRVSTCPTVSGEKIVMRILDVNSTNLEIDMLCFLSQQKAHFLHALSRPQGMILVTGPTGSGKTMTLYSALNILNTDDRNLSTVEDPVEINVHGMNQVSINPKAGLTFASTLRALLRQDPDVIMVGEIRDLETAEIAVKAAQTGHLVLSTLHTNSAAETLTRLVNMGIPAFNLASSISLIIAQRLIRRLCPACKVIRNDLTSVDTSELRLLRSRIHGTAPLLNSRGSDVTEEIFRSYQAQGCHQCTDGYRGRLALYEVMPISKDLAQMIMTGKSAPDLLKQAQIEGMLTMFESGLEQVRMGLTSLEEITRIMVD